MTTGDLVDELQAALDAVSDTDVVLGGGPEDNVWLDRQS